jgi:hypothetical protein
MNFMNFQGIFPSVHSFFQGNFSRMSREVGSRKYFPWLSQGIFFEFKSYRLEKSKLALSVLESRKHNPEGHLTFSMLIFLKRSALRPTSLYMAERKSYMDFPNPLTDSLYALRYSWKRVRWLFPDGLLRKRSVLWSISLWTADRKSYVA